MFGLPDNSELSQVVHQLTRTHHRTVDGLTGVEQPLLVQLRLAVASDTAGAYGGGGTRSGAPLDVNALTIWQGIYSTVASHWPGRGDLVLQHTSTPDRLERWVAALAGTDQEVYLLEMCHYWRQQIRDLLEPPQLVPLRGVVCPTCRAAKAVVAQGDEQVQVDTLLAYLSETPVRVTCRGCAATWLGQDLAYIGAAMEFLATLEVAQ